jgi:hypothetical protein
MANRPKRKLKPHRKRKLAATSRASSCDQDAGWKGNRKGKGTGSGRLRSGRCDQLGLGRRYPNTTKPGRMGQGVTVKGIH